MTVKRLNIPATNWKAEGDREVAVVEVPGDAMYSAIPLVWKVGDGIPGEDGATLYPFTMTARTFDGVDNYWWGAMYHDFAGMIHDPTICVDFCHNDGEVIGTVNGFSVDSVAGLQLSGNLVSLQENDRAHQIWKQSRNKVPYQSSINFSDMSSLVIEQVQEGMSAQVNDRTVEGPGIIFRKWRLRGVAVCPYGLDPGTSTKFSNQDGPASVRISRSLTEMSKETTEPGDTGTTPEPAKPQTELSANSVSRDELNRFVAKFGSENGVKWLVEDGLTYTQALERHTEALEAKLSQKGETVAELEGRIEAAKMGAGEATPAATGEQTADAPAPSMFSVPK